MLRALEQYLLVPIDAALPPAIGVHVGPFYVDPSWPNNQRSLVIHARKLSVLDPPPDDSRDGEAFLFETITWAANGVTTNFTLPALQGTTYEVEAPPGQPVTRGDDYLVDGSVIRFYRPPAAANPGVLARVRTAAAHGYVRRRPCAITLEITSYGVDMALADEAFAIALQVALAQLTRVPRLAMPVAAGATVLLRVLEPRTTLVSIERTLLATKPRVVAGVLRVEGELDAIVASGAPAPVSIIESIAGEAQVGSDPSMPVTFVPSETP